MNITFELRAAYRLAGVEIPIILSQENKEENGEKYDERREIFNTKFRFMPAAIVLCTTTEQVSVAVKFTSKLALPLRVRSGGHDHEGECSGTDTILLDLSKMNTVTIDGKDKKAEADSKPRLVRVQPGTPFKKLTTELAEKDLMIPHGTCGTVCIAGYTMGGGWGPWTRKYGMCCERVVGATVVLGDGSIRKLRMSKSSEEERELSEEERELLWAIKGGGGFSYGIITEFVIETFETQRPPQHLPC
jgi:FAD/FMN-containing dehydrogenase